eukprot:7333946-Pyramimonas_sp.AAC.1
MFGHRVGNLLVSTYRLKPDMFKLACFAYPIQIDTMCAMMMRKCWCTSLLDNLDHGPAVLQENKVHLLRAARRRRLWVH